MDVYDDHKQYDGRIAAFRDEEYPMLRSATYLDHAGTALYSRSLIDAFSADMLSSMVGNPHSASSSSQTTSHSIDDIRVRVLRLFGADPNQFDVIFVANATAAIKLVADAFRDDPSGFWYGYHKDAHTSLVGVRELATQGSYCFKSDAEVENWLNDDHDMDEVSCPALVAYPGQSNMNGRRLSLDWPGRVRRHRRSQAYSLLDAAALVATTPLDLSDAHQAPDFIALSFYKIFGFPDLGALIVHNGAAHVFRHRRYFGGGTVEAVACLDEQWHTSKSTSLHARVEDGTLPLRNIMALRCAMDTHVRLYGPQGEISRHTGFLAKVLYDRMSTLNHANGRPVFEIYKDAASTYNEPTTQGPVLAFNIRNSKGGYHSCYEINKLAMVKEIHLRTGTLCNPAGVAGALQLCAKDLRDSFDAGVRCGGGGDVRNGKPIAMARISLGASSTLKDVDSFIGFVEEFFVESTISAPDPSRQPASGAKHYIETITVYPIKSCGGWQVPPGQEWPIRKEGLAWDRQWCLLHQGTKAYLNQKRCPMMTLLRPILDFRQNLLHIQFGGTPSQHVPSTISIPLDESRCLPSSSPHPPWQHSSSEESEPYIYHDSAITEYFSSHLGVPCYLARVSAAVTPQRGRGTKEQTKPRSITLSTIQSRSPLSVPGAFPTPPPSPPPSFPTMANESPVLTISRSSVDYVNRSRGENSVHKRNDSTDSLVIEPETFRANILLAHLPLSAEERSTTEPFEEESWSRMRILRPLPRAEAYNPGGKSDGKHAIAELEVLGRCRRCQMICINQQSGIRRPDPFTTLAKLRQGEGGVCFGVHCGLSTMPDSARRLEVYIRVGDVIEGIRRH